MHKNVCSFVEFTWVECCCTKYLQVYVLQSFSVKQKYAILNRNNRKSFIHFNP